MMCDKNGKRLYVIAAPSGAGKTTLVHALVAAEPDLRFSISYTTRPQRSNEADGSDYFFVTEERFHELREQGEMLEWARVFDNLYASSRSQVEAHLADGHDVLLEIDWQGAQQVRESMPESVTIFILPPSRDELERRLRNRRTDSDEVIARRLRDALSDMAHWEEFDYAVVNDNLDEALAQLQAIMAGEGAAQSTSNPEIRARALEIIGL